MEEPLPKERSGRSPLSVVNRTTEVPDFGKVQPQAVELEEAVLGALMLDKEALIDVLDVLRPESFYKDDHKKIYEAILSLFEKSEPIDILTVTQRLRERGDLEGVGGPFYIAQLTNRVASSANIEYHSRIIAQKHIQRELIKISSDTIKLAYDEGVDVFNLLDIAESKLFEVSESNIRKSYDNLENLLAKAIKNLEKVSKSDSTSGVPTGFHSLDRVTGGFQRSDMIVLAARPGMGKTAFVLSLARNAAVDFKRPVVIFSLEMSSLQLVNRLIASETEISAEKLKKGNLEAYEWQQLTSRVTKLSNAPIFINDSPALSVFELRAQCRRLKAEKKIELVIIDYLQLMTTANAGKGNRQEEISLISRAIKSLAKELDVPIIALSQLSREVEKRTGDKRPQLSDLRESGAIEQDADMVMFIYRPEYYNLDKDAENVSVNGMTELIIAKHRNGSLEKVPVRFVDHLAKFTNIDDDMSYTPNSDFDSRVENRLIESKINRFPNTGEAPF